MGQPDLNNNLSRIYNTLQEIKLELVSRSGLVPQISYIGESSNFYIVFAVTNHNLQKELLSLISSDNLTDKDLQQYKDKFVNLFMILHHKYITNYLKFNWNWD